MRRIPAARLTLEPQVEAHAEEMFALLQDPAIYEHENEPPASVERLRDRFRRLESRTSADGSEAWLNWVVRLHTAELAGFVQATVRGDGSAAIAYVLASRFWGKGLASEAVGAMVRELAENYRVTELSAVLKRGNVRSVRLLERLGLEPAPAAAHARFELEPGEVLMQGRIPTP